VEGLSATLIDVLARVERSDGSTQIARLNPSAPEFIVEAAPTLAQVAATYLGLGIEHILFGFDHLLFVLALLLLVEGWRRLALTITAFTVAHSLTLVAATFHLVRLPPTVVEALIALSIVLVAVEIVRTRSGETGLTARWPWLIAFVFGLLHGLGFAGALAEIGLPAGAIPEALLFFNFGVEFGQLLVTGIVLTSLRLARETGIRWPIWSWRAATYAIGSLAAFWTIERLSLLA
jgi:hydrogenase/urease accessory protein HupE